MKPTTTKSSMEGSRRGECGRGCGGVGVYVCVCVGGGASQAWRARRVIAPSHVLTSFAGGQGSRGSELHRCLSPCVHALAQDGELTAALPIHAPALAFPPATPVQAAIRSAINIARMKPFCMYSGSLTSPIYTWLVDAGVTIIQVRAALVQLPLGGGVSAEAWGRHTGRCKRRHRLTTIARRLAATAGRVCIAVQAVGGHTRTHGWRWGEQHGLGAGACCPAGWVRRRRARGFHIVRPPAHCPPVLCSTPPSGRTPLPRRWPATGNTTPRYGPGPPHRPHRSLAGGQSSPASPSAAAGPPWHACGCCAAAFSCAAAPAAARARPTPGRRLLRARCHPPRVRPPRPDAAALPPVRPLQYTRRRPSAAPPQVHSHLYATDGRMVGTFQRIDIPILHEFDQYHYVLFTGGRSGGLAPCTLALGTLELCCARAGAWGSRGGGAPAAVLCPLASWQVDGCLGACTPREAPGRQRR